jgi:misacylated tRNA(Ala) deacylase
MKENIYPPMHTAEHLLNQTMVRLFKTDRCFSAHIEKKKSKCDYKFNRALTGEEVKNLEEKIKEIIKVDLPVLTEMMTAAETKKRFGARAPKTEDDVRIVKIGDYDAIPCLGEHVKSTKEVGEFKIISSDYENGVLRVRYKLN